MTFTTTAGATIALSSTAPGSYNQAGYEGVSFTTVGEVTDLGEFPDRVYDLISHRPLATDGEQNAKGNFTLGSQTVTFAVDPSDAGQALVAAAKNSRNKYSLRLQHPTLGTIYGRALIMGAPRSYGADNNVVSATMTIQWTMASASETGIVTVAAA